jgi:hypothetical protein
VIRPGLSAALVAVVAAVLLLGACDANQPGPRYTPKAYALQSIPGDTGTNGCRGVGLTATLHGDPADPAVAWIEGMTDHARVVPLWPADLHAIFDPTLEIVDAKGTVLTSEGDFIDGGCVVGPGRNGILLAPPYPGFHLDCSLMEPAECGQRASRIAAAWNRSLPPITLVRFVNGDGQYIVIYRDGSEAHGVEPGE